MDIPAEYNGKPVKKIGHYAFHNCQSLTSVSIPDGVIVIDNMAFHNCQSLTSINIPDSMRGIGHGVFSYCIKLNYIDLNNVTCCGSNAFQMCDDPLCNGGLCNSVTFIAPNSSLQTVILGKDITNISYNMLLGCNNLKSLVIPESVTTIDSAAMAYCINLKNVIIKCKKGSLATSARCFYNCPLLEKIYMIDGNGWSTSDTIDGKPIEILPADGAVVAKTMSVKSMTIS